MNPKFPWSKSPLFPAAVPFKLFGPEDPARTVLMFLTRGHQTLFFETSARAAVHICEQEKLFVFIAIALLLFQLHSTTAGAQVL